jgi:hypothetical protein
VKNPTEWLESNGYPLRGIIADPCKEGIIFGQALRVLERCSETEDVEKHLGNFQSKLQKRNYPEKLISSKFSEARKRTRKNLINQSRHEKS